YNDPRLGCALPSGHDGPHVTGSGRGWHDSDDMDGGVAAALIEKEAEESPSVDYEAMWWDAERRAKEAEDRADDAHNLIVALRADLAATETRAEQAERERDRWHSMWRQRAIKHLAAKKRATRAEAQAAIRGRAVVIYQARAREAESQRDQQEAIIRRQDRYI